MILRASLSSYPLMPACRRLAACNAHPWTAPSTAGKGHSYSTFLWPRPPAKADLSVGSCTLPFDFDDLSNAGPRADPDRERVDLGKARLLGSNESAAPPIADDRDVGIQLLRDAHATGKQRPDAGHAGEHIA